MIQYAPVDFFEFLSTKFAARSHQAEINIVERLMQGRNRVRVEPTSCDRGRRKNDAFARDHAAGIEC